jgi:hypothetical protein
LTENELPDKAKRLIADHIVSVEQLEILLLLHRQPESEWTAKAVAEQIRTSERSAAARLVDLVARGLLACRDKNPAIYRYDPANAELGYAVDLLEQAYSEKRYTVIDLIFSKPIENLRVYADAFRFKKDDSDG